MASSSVSMQDFNKGETNSVFRIITLITHFSFLSIRVCRILLNVSVIVVADAVCPGLPYCITASTRA